jgi:CRP-like cAMP-binding protein
MTPSEVAEVPLFASMSPEATALVEAAGATDVPAGQVLARGGDVGEGMFVVLEGTVVAERGDLHLPMGPGDFFGELTLLVPDAPRVARVRATTDARIIALTRDDFDQLLATEPSFALVLLKELAARLVQARTGH